jgi:hypothetical protein
MKPKKNLTRTETFELTIDGKPVLVKATSFQTHSMETHYRVSINGSPVYIFGWNPNLNRVTALDRGSAAANIPPQVANAIGDQLYTRLAA